MVASLGPLYSWLGKGPAAHGEFDQLRAILCPGLPGMCTLYVNSAREQSVKMWTLPLLAGENPWWFNRQVLCFIGLTPPVPARREPPSWHRPTHCGAARVSRGWYDAPGSRHVWMAESHNYLRQRYRPLPAVARFQSHVAARVDGRRPGSHAWLVGTVSEPNSRSEPPEALRFLKHREVGPLTVSVPARGVSVGRLRR
jgi:hypothetical protein